MPELPEVETIKNELAPWVVGQSFTKVSILDTELVCGGSAEEVRRGLIGQKVESLERRGRYLIFHLSNGRSLVIHLRMTGVLLLIPEELTTMPGRFFISPMGTAWFSATGADWG